MVAISPMSVSASAYCRAEFQANPSSSRTARFNRPLSTRSADSPIPPGPFPISVKTRSTAESIELLRRPPPLFLSNFFAPLFPQIPETQKKTHSDMVAQGKRPVAFPQSDEFPHLTVIKPKGQPPASTATKDQVPSQPEVPPPFLTKEPKKPPPKKSFREAVSSSWSKDVDVSFSSTSVKASSKYEDEPAYVISEEEEAKLAQKYQFALIAKFNRGRPTMAVIRQDVNNVGFLGEVHVGLIDQKHIILQFQLESDSHRIWMKKTWSFRGFQASIFRWSVDFCPEKESSIVPVWISLPLLPLHLCDKKVLYGIGSTIGDPLKLDMATAAMEKVLRPSEARMCIAVDILKPLPQRVRIGPQDKGKWQQVVYEDLPEFCSTCSKIGHSQLNCRGKGPVKVWTPKKKPAEKVKTPLTISTEANGPSIQGKKNQELSKSRQNVGSPGLDSGTPSTKELMRAVLVVNRNLEVPEPSCRSLVTLPRSPLFCAQDNVNQFFTNLGQFLELINSQEAGALDQPLIASTNQHVDNANAQGKLKTCDPMNQNVKLVNPVSTNGWISWDNGQLLSSKSNIQINQTTPIKIWEEGEQLNRVAPFAACNTPDLERNNTCDKVATNGQRLWEKGEASGLHKINHNSDLAILQDMETLIWDEGKFSSIQNVSSPSGLALLKAINLDTDGEDDREEYWSEGDEVDRWTETSFDEVQQDKLEDFIDRMERKQTPIKQTRSMEALLSPKISERRLRKRNPFFSYSETRRWNRR